MPRSPVLSVDVDDVCFDFPAVYARWRDAAGRPSFDPDADHRYRFPELLGLTVAEYHRDCERLLAETIDQPPVPGCVQALAALAAAGTRVWLVSARTVDQQPGTEAWASRWLPMVDGVVCIGRTDNPVHLRAGADTGQHSSEPGSQHS